MRIKHPLIPFLFLLLCGVVMASWGSCPLLTHTDPDEEREFQNVCQQIPNLSNPVSLKGVTDGSSAKTGNVGEYIYSYPGDFQNVAGASGAWGNYTSITLTAGDWDILAIVSVSANGASCTGNVAVAISTTSGSSNIAASDGDNIQFFPATALGVGSVSLGENWASAVKLTISVKSWSIWIARE